jgi:hypothetical protein
VKRKGTRRKTTNGECVVLVPTVQNIEPGCEEALRELESSGYVVSRRFGVSDITMGRCAMATEALAQGFSELMWIDSDILFRAKDVDKLRRHGLPLVGAIYAKKGDRNIACVLPDGSHEIVFGTEGGLLEVKYMATGFFLTRREVYDEMFKKRRQLGWEETRMGLLPFFFHRVGGTGRKKNYLSEDYSFCANAAAAGYRIMADTTIRLGHIGSYVYSWEEMGGLPERRSIVKVKVLDESTAPEKVNLPGNIIAGPRLRALRRRTADAMRDRLSRSARSVNGGQASPPSAH